ncbi:MAG TPA: hypothetical protein VGG06_11580 [Thermoanaerobaculia bacterium]|jgi:hypothetical protein
MDDDSARTDPITARLEELKRLVTGEDIRCQNCGRRGWPDRHTPGNGALELLLWLLGLVPGLVYTIWRRRNRGWICALCGSADLAWPRPIGPRGGLGVFTSHNG